MNVRTADQLQIDTPNGGRVIVSFADRDSRSGSIAIEAAASMTRTDGPTGELEGVIVAEAGRLGLDAAVSGDRDPTIVTVRSPIELDSPNR